MAGSKVDEDGRQADEEDVPGRDEAGASRDEDSFGGTTDGGASRPIDPGTLPDASREFLDRLNTRALKAASLSLSRLGFGVDL